MTLAGNGKGRNISWGPLAEGIEIDFSAGSLSLPPYSSPLPENILLLSSIVPPSSTLFSLPNPCWLWVRIPEGHDQALAAQGKPVIP